jgi:hypothetical protein
MVRMEGDITGARIGINYRYRVQVVLDGGFAPYNTIDSDFGNFYEGEWIPGSDVIGVSVSLRRVLGRWLLKRAAHMPLILTDPTHSNHPNTILAVDLI